MQYTSRGTAVGVGGHSDVSPKERGEVTLVRAPDLGTDVDEEHVGLGQQPLGVLDPGQTHVLMGSQPGGVLEQVRKMGGAHLRHGGERLQAHLLLQMGLDIGECAPQLVRHEPAAYLALAGRAAA